MVHVRKGTERKEGDKGSIGASMKVEFRVSAQAGDLPMDDAQKKGGKSETRPATKFLATSYSPARSPEQYHRRWRA